jgi:alkanesulfonate monooxygenase SsuD/methylene tetrahydromethanopterin reductase-like flavin-dependent oxidoreductase (luciferase family)
MLMILLASEREGKLSMKYGLAASGTLSPSILEKMAILAEETGYDSMLITDHFMGTRGGATNDAWSLIPYLAAKTKNLRLGTCVTPIPFRPPAILAKSIATCDNLSRGRIILGVGAGWFKPEFEGFSKWLDDKDRVDFTSEALEFITELWTNEAGPLNHEGKFITSHGAAIEPKPIQKPYPSLWFGSFGRRMLQLAGRFGNGWIPVGPRWVKADYPVPDRYAEMKRIIVAELEKRKVPLDQFVFSVLINIADYDTLRSDVKSYVSAGMNYFILGLAGETNENEILANIENVSTEIGKGL